nr:type I polyketide synthase [Actinokineospora enzanensis]
MSNEDKLREYLKRAIAELHEARQQLRDLADDSRQPIAIVGMACRLPGGVRSPEELWELAFDGVDAISTFPDNRGWDLDGLYDPDPTRQGTTYSREGGFLHDAGEFDAGFFGISPREALAMDPQQRLLLETSWEAFERAGIDPRGLTGTPTGVFVGTGHGGYDDESGAHRDEVAGHLLTGNTVSVASGRISFTFGLEGPAVTVDTACSSSLVALHLAVRSLRAGECSLALAGGVTVMSTPRMFVEFSRQRGLAPDGRCKSFAASADGTGWSEGAGILLVERLSDAVRRGHRVLAVIRGSAVNQDGASNGLTAPNGPSQQRVIRQALADAGLSTSDIDVIEAHGTGTTLGDPIEAQALLATYGQDRERPLLLGSLKSNIGHTQAAAGVAGIIKMVLALRHGVLPKTLHVDEPTPHVDWSAGAAKLLTDAEPWPRRDEPRRAAVSSFGVSGTNAHVVLEEAPQVSARREPVPGLVELPWVLSARSREALVDQAGRLAAFVRESDGLDLGDAAYSLVAGRSAMEHRAAVVAGDRAELLAGLDALSAGQAHPGVVEGVAESTGDAVFVFPGQGSQWVGMAAELMAASPVFAEHMHACADAISNHVDWSLLDILKSDNGTADTVGAAALERVDVVQPALFAMMVSLAEMWRAHGVHPAAVIGHSQGEIAAACVTGALSLDDAARVVALRSKAMTRLGGRGGMASVALTVDEVRRRLDEHGRGLTLAVINGPTSVVVSGDAEVLDDFLAHCERDQVRVRRIQADFASHSAVMAELRDELLTLLASIKPRSVDIPFYSAVTGARIDTAELDAEYWYRNLRDTVLFEQATRTLLDAGYRALIEISPHPVVTAPIRETIEAAGVAASITPTLRRAEGGPHRFRLSLAAVWAQGTSVDWDTHVTAAPHMPDLPTYPFQRQHYWLTPQAAPDGTSAADPVGAGFWSAVEREDLPALSSALDLDGTAETSLSDVLPALSSWLRRRTTRSAVDTWRYRARWSALTDLPSTTTDRVLVLVPDHTDDWITDLLTALGRRASVKTLIVSGEDDQAAITERLREALAEPVDSVLSLLALDERLHPSAPSVPRGLVATAWAALATADLDARLWCLTRGAVSVDRFDPPTSLVQAEVWGLGRVAALEYPLGWGGLIDLPAAIDRRTVSRLLDVVAAGREDQVAVRPSGVFTRRLVRASAGEGEREDTWSTHGTVLVTGGTGALGARVARWLAGAGAEHLVLISRRGADAPGAAELTAELTALGARVTMAACDAADRDALAGLLARIPADLPLTGVVHAAGVLDDGVLDSVTLEQFQAALRPKVDVAANLHELTRDHDLSMFVLFSSIVGALGNAGQAGYAAANAYLDALAERRQADGLPATSVAWGPWAGGGMSTEVAQGGRMRRDGLRPMAPDLAIAALERSVVEGTNAVVLDADWARHAPARTGARPNPLIEDIPEARAALAAEPVAGGLRGQLAGLAPNERERLLTDLVRGEVARALGHASPAAVDVRRAFRDMGFDSLTSVEVRNRLTVATGVRLPSTLLFDYPSTVAVVDYLRDELVGAVEQPAPSTPAPVVVTDEPIAIVSMACRFPGGVRSPDDLWDLVDGGLDVISRLPVNRGWDVASLYDPDPERQGTSYVQEGGFIHEAGEFDPGFFGISPREALAMDPQQRLLLETSWEAFERAGIDPESLRGSETGVFVGAITQDYQVTLGGAPEQLAGHLMTGNAGSIMSGRISYTYGLEGPAVTMDTGCSSSLVAVHLAVRSLRSGECSLALAGGVTVMSTPESFVEFSRQRGLSRDGRCKAFDASADGMAFAEGVGWLLVERLSDAVRRGHPVLAVIRGSAINQDGASNGLTAPNGPSQQRVIRQALADAGLSTTDIDAVEAHGTGTPLGDPIEAQAILATYGQDRDRPLLLGSVKSNLGHTQAAAGVAGVMKMVLAMRHGVLPKTLHVSTPTPHVDWSAGEVALVTEPSPWPETGQPRRAGISSFGISGTNAHLVMEEPPARVDEPVAPSDTRAGLVAAPWVLSGRNRQALAEQAARLAAFVRGSGPDPRDVAYSLVTGRSAMAHRAAVVADDPAELLAGLDAVATGDVHPSVVEGVAEGAGDAVFVFPGQGSQWVGMAAELLATSPVFADHLHACAVALSSYVDWSLLDVLRGAPGAASLERVDVVQPALFAVMVSLAEVWRAHGVRPAAVVGHSQGEIAAACVAGALTLPDAARVVALRSKALVALAGRGGMVSVALPVDQVRARLDERACVLSVATVNGPGSVVVSGPSEALDDWFACCERDGIRVRRIPVDYASHSVEVERIQDELLTLLAPITPRSADIPFYSTVTGEPIDTADLDAEYWYRNLRRTVEFEQATRALLAAGYRSLIEVSPHPVVATAIQETIEDSGVPAAITPTLRRDEGGLDRFRLAAATAWVNGTGVAWAAGFADTDARLVDLPTYAFQRQHYWFHGAGSARQVASAGLDSLDHPLLGAAVPLARGDELVVTARWSLRSHPWLADHAVSGVVLVPGAALVEAAIRVGDEVGCGRLVELTLQAPVVLPERDELQVQFVVGAAESGHRPLTIHTRPAGPDSRWTQHAVGTLGPAPAAAPDTLTTWPPTAESVSTDDFHALLAERGYEFGPAFRGTRAAWRRGDEVFAEVVLPDEAGEAAGFGLHPALLDAALQTANLGHWNGRTARAVAPFSWAGVSLHAAGATAARVRVTSIGPDTIAVLVADETGAPVASIDALTVRPIESGALAAASRATRDWLLRVDWTPVPAGPVAGEHAVVGHDAERLVAELTEAGVTVTRRPDRTGLVESLTTDTAPDAVYVLATDSTDPADLPSTLDQTLSVLQTWLADDRLTRTTLVVVTREAVTTDLAGTVRDLPGASVWGLVRSAQSEYPGRIVLADIDSHSASWRALPGVIDAGEPQIAVRQGIAHAPRLVRTHRPDALTIPDPDRPWRLDIPEKGTVDNLVLVPCPEASEPLEPGQVRIEVRAAGINFRDVLNTLGMYPGAEGLLLGTEAAGVVVETGPGVTGLAEGDRVMGLVESGAFGSRAVADARMLVPIPTGWSYVQAASVPVVFLTAYYGLHDLAGLAAGESVLVHAAAGGVGMAAVQLAHHWGAKVFGTASEFKQELLRAQDWPADRLASSRTLDFEDRFRAATGGRGVDVVLNSLAGEFVDASLRLLAPGGRLVEMGKTDIRAADDVARAHPGVSYQAFEVAQAGPERVQQMLAELVALFEQGVIRPVPIITRDVRQARDAFRLMSQARHVGKIVLTVPRRRDPEGTVLITGGTGELGGRLARHLVTEHGTRHLLLTSRSGPDSPGARDLHDELTGLGAHVTITACDVSHRAQVADLIAAIPAEHPLTAVVHAAGVLDDGVLDALTPDRLRTVLAPKVDAARHLHELTRHLDLAEFVLFSGGAGVFGNAGQANYAAANAFLDGFATHLRATGHPATALAWGLWADASAMTGHLDDTDLAKMRRSGVLPLAAADGLALFDAALATGEPFLVPLRLDTAQLRSHDPAEIPALLRALHRGPARRVVDRAAGDSGGVRARLVGLAAEERRTALLDLVSSYAAAVLGHSGTDQVRPDRAFRELGFDSLTAVEIRNRLNTVTGLRLPASLVFDYPNPAALADHLAGRLGDGTPHTPVLATPSTSDEPIAIVGMACRFPGGVRSPEDLWELLSTGSDAIGAFPADRDWDVDGMFDGLPDDPGVSRTREGGFLAGVAEFDADFFGIGPREAVAMDPQQRLLLEVAWEVFERAGIDPKSVRGSRTGVFAGLSLSDYLSRVGEIPDELAGFISNGNAVSVVSGRVAYALGLEGPAVTVDTACSSSLVALHLAMQSLRQGECSLALAGGVTVMSSPTIFVDFSRQRGLAADGRCKAFSSSADGTGFAEGVGLVLVERLSDARRNGHRVLAVVRGSAMNQDGASNGLTSPNGPSQQRVIRQALANAGVAAHEVDAVEAHGTGTRLGDPIEAQALLATYGQDRDRPLLLGSVKSNLGHTQAASGVAGVMKTVLALRHGVLPKSLHVDETTPHVDWSAGAVSVLAEAAPWPETGRPRRAGVSSFGISGTNVHVIIEQGPDDPGPARPDDESRVVPWVLSARTERGLRGQARALLAHLDDRPDLPLVDAASSLITTRATLERRAVVIGATGDELRTALRALADGQPATGVVHGDSAVGRDRKVVMVFPGQGSQWAGMGVDLLATSPAFAERIIECEQALAPHVGWSLRDVLHGVAGAPSLELVDVAQPVLWAVMVSLAEVWRAHGVEPAAVVGHSQGEIAAACVSGALSLTDAARVVALRAAAIARELAGHGGMASVAAGRDDVVARMAPWGDRLSVAASNGPSTVVISGELSAVDEFATACAADGVRVKKIPVDYASHSAQVERLHDTLLAELADLRPRASRIPFFSTVIGDWITTTELDAEYWYRNLRRPVRFEEAVRTLVGEGFDAFVESSPHPVLTMGVEDTIQDVEAHAVAIGSLRRDDGGPARVLTALAEAHVHGIAVDWRATVSGGRPVDLPTYAFQRERFWLRPAAAVADAVGLGSVVTIADGGGVVLTGKIDARTWPAGYRVRDAVILPGTALLEWALRAGDEIGCPVLRDLTEHAPLVLPEGDAIEVQVVVGPESADSRLITIHARPLGDTWTRHATGTLTTRRPADPDRLTWPPADAEPLDVEARYVEFDEHGIDHGPLFRTIRAVWRRGAEVFAEVELTGDALADAPGRHLHPALLQALLSSGPIGDEPGLPDTWHEVSLFATGASLLRVRLTPADDGAVSVVAVDGTGAPVITIGSVTRRPVPAGQFLSAARSDLLFELSWTPLPGVGAHHPSGTWAVIGDTRLATPDSHTFDDLSAIDPVPDFVVLSGTGPNAHESTLDTLCAVQSWLTDPRFARSRLIVVTEGAIDAGEVSGLSNAGIWGLVRSAQTEHPGRFLLVDWDGHESSADTFPTAVATALATDEPQLALRAGEVTVPRLTRSNATGGEWRVGDGTVLITGGTGTLGAEVARHLVTRHGVRALALMSRRGIDAPGAHDLRAELTGLGAQVDVIACDAADRDVLARALDGIPVRAVVHAAGVVEDGLLENLNADQLARVWRPKAEAAWNLHELTHDLTAFVLFSSYAGIGGGLTQANYAAANTFLDALAHHRHAHGLPATSLAWGYWAKTSDLTSTLDQVDVARFARAGLLPMSTEQGLAALDAALGSDSPALVPVRLDLRAIKADVPSVLRGLVRTTLRRATGAADVGEDDLTRRLAGLSAAKQETLLLDLVASHVATVLGHGSPEAVAVDRGFLELGMTSLTGVELRNRLGVETGLRLPTTLIFDHPTPLGLARHLRAELGTEAAGHPVFAELAALESAVSVAVAELTTDNRSRLLTRLRQLQWKLDGDTGGGVALDTDTDLPSDLVTSTDDEMFDLIDKELGLG